MAGWFGGARGERGRASRWLRQGTRPRVWAHRGDSAHVTENTLAAFESARAKAADGVELDVRLDADGEVVVFHDDTLDRLAGRAGTIETTTTAARRTLELRGGHRVPSLTEAFEACGELEVNVELKSRRIGRAGALAVAVARVLAQTPRPERVIVSSFDPVALAQLRRVSPATALAFLFHEKELLPLRRGWPALAVGACAVHPEQVLLTPERVQRWHQQGYAVNTWTVDEPQRLRELAALGVDGVFTNDPAATRRVFDGLS